MEAYVRWFAEQERFYQLMLCAIVLFGVTVAATGAVTANVVLLGLGICWLLGGGALTVVLANRDPESG
ncbi:hypothetical protein [Natrarchaeobaculum sulfurireducens]|uniref:Uncharacterized protein n=1 Tax=Natrarchaeobaculum sulfurireducens TaxID=2044521 RepID=A0A346PJ27_9EURY|nr:hypothetical protein [Natrarchaeobaculum sulfurireducens]AXR79522.1 hypothetical protein AArc1_3217 [Natrarchaeobaculum sulfurireducens]